MKLNLESRRKLRLSIISYLNNGPCPKDLKIKLAPEVLEDLLFEKMTYDGKPVKFPVFSKYLKYFDLSEVSFEDVTWSQTTAEKLGFDRDEYTRSSGLQLYKAPGAKYRTPVDYSWTNAKIDFSKSWDAKNSKDGRGVVEHCIFAGTNLSNNDLSKLSVIDNCNFSSTNIKITDMQAFVHETQVTNSIFDYVNFVEHSISIPDLIEHFDESSFRKTRLHIVGSREEATSCSKDGTNLSAMIVQDQIGGCYLNGRYINTKEESKKLKEQLQQQYAEYEATYAGSIEKQVMSQVDQARKIEQKRLYDIQEAQVKEMERRMRQMNQDSQARSYQRNDSRRRGNK